MGRKIIGVLIILWGGFFLYVAALAVKGSPTVIKQLEEAPFITDGKVHPENEGKNIVLIVPVDSLYGAKDDTFGLSFDYPIIKRKVEKLNWISSQRIAWQSVYNNDDGIGEEIFYGGVDSMEYEIAPGMLNGLSSTHDIKRSEFNSEELSSFLEYYNALSAEDYNGILYITDTSTKYFKDYDEEEDDKASKRNDYRDYKEEAGSLRVHYQGLSADKGIDSVALIGKQIGNSIVKSDDIDTLSCFENVHTREELLKEVKFLQKLGVGGIGIAFNVILIIVGIVLIVYKPKSKNA